MSAPIRRDCQIMSFSADASRYRCGVARARRLRRSRREFRRGSLPPSAVWIFTRISRRRSLFCVQHRETEGRLLTGVRGDVYVASSRRLSVAVALSSPRADTQILSRNSLAQCLMVHQYQVQCDTEAPVCAPSSQLLSTVTGPSVTKCCAVTPVLEHYPAAHL